MTPEAPDPKAQEGAESRRETEAEALLRLEELELGDLPPQEPEWFAALVDGRLDPEQRRIREAALDEDPGLRARFEAYRRTVRFLSTADRDEVGPNRFLRARILGAWQEEQGLAQTPARAGGGGMMFAFFGSLGVAAAALVALLVLLENDSRERPDSAEVTGRPASGLTVDDVAGGRYGLEKDAKATDLPELSKSGRWDGFDEGKTGPAAERRAEGLPTRKDFGQGAAAAGEVAKVETPSSEELTRRKDGIEALEQDKQQEEAEEEKVQGQDDDAKAAGRRSGKAAPTAKLGYSEGGEKNRESFDLGNSIPRDTDKLVHLIDSLEAEQARFKNDRQRPTDDKVLVLCFDLEAEAADQARRQLAGLESSRLQLQTWDSRNRDRAQQPQDALKAPEPVTGNSGGAAKEAAPQAGGRNAGPGSVATPPTPSAPDSPRVPTALGPGRQRAEGQTLTTGQTAPTRGLEHGIQLGLVTISPTSDADILVLRGRRSQLLQELVWLMQNAERTVQAQVARDQLVPVMVPIAGGAKGEARPDGRSRAAQDRYGRGADDFEFGGRGGGGANKDQDEPDAEDARRVRDEPVPGQAPATDPSADSAQPEASKKSSIGKLQVPESRHFHRADDPVIELHVQLRRLVQRQPVPGPAPSETAEPMRPTKQPATPAEKDPEPRK